MKKVTIGDKTFKYFSPEFESFVAKGMISVKKHPSFPDVEFPADKVEQSRKITLCQVVIPVQMDGKTVYLINTGISILDPNDSSPEELGRKIAEGRALKNNIKCLETIVSFKPTTALKEAIKSLAKLHVERNLDLYVSQMHDALKL